MIHWNEYVNVGGNEKGEKLKIERFVGGSKEEWLFLLNWVKIYKIKKVLSMNGHDGKIVVVAVMEK